MIDLNETQKITGLPIINERESARLKYDAAVQRMLAEPSEETIDAFVEANKVLFEVEDAYRIGARLALEHALALVS